MVVTNISCHGHNTHSVTITLFIHGHRARRWLAAHWIQYRNLFKHFFIF